jgi:hypothetical protein
MDRVLNRLNGVRALGAAVVSIAIAVAALRAGGWQGYLIGGVFLTFGAFMVVAAFRWPKFRSSRP